MNTPKNYMERWKEENVIKAKFNNVKDFEE
jgi:hypothetical protein